MQSLRLHSASTAVRKLAVYDRSRIPRRGSSTVAAMREEAPATCKDLMTAGHKYLDVRSKQEFASGHADEAVNIPFMFKGDAGMVPNQDFITEVNAAFPDKAEDIVVGCQSGRRSAMAIQAMQGDGYTSLVNMAGGYGAWSSEGL